MLGEVVAGCIKSLCGPESVSGHRLHMIFPDLRCYFERDSAPAIRSSLKQIKAFKDFGKNYNLDQKAFYGYAEKINFIYNVTKLLTQSYITSKLVVSTPVSTDHFYWLIGS